jgi:hypothetical protein
MQLIRQTAKTGATAVELDPLLRQWLYEIFSISTQSCITFQRASRNKAKGRRIKTQIIGIKEKIIGVK